MTEIVFLKPHHTVVPTEAHDYPEWHQGRPHFGLWYVEIRDPALLEYLETLRAHFSDLLFQPNTRQFHITLFICGFYTPNLAHFNDDFTHAQLSQQIQLFQQQSWSNIQLKTQQLNSFDSALFVEILDSADRLRQIRHTLEQCSDEIAALDYCPHITLGLYKHAVSSDHVFERMHQVKQQSFHLDIDQLTFGYYQAQQLQGPLTALYQHFLRTT